MTEEPMNDVCRKVLRAAERAWCQKDFGALERASEEVPAGYTLCVFSFRDGDPSFCIFAADQLPYVTGGFKCLDVNELIARSALEAGPEAITEPDRPTLPDGLQGSVEPREESGRGNL